MQRTSRVSTVYPIAVRELEVLRVKDLSPAMRRIVLGGAGLAEHERNGVYIPAFQSTGFDDGVKIIIPDPVTGERPFPQPQPHGIVKWTEASTALARTYTVRSYDAELGELSLDVALHDAGLITAWSDQIKAGESVYIVGPRASVSLPDHTDWLLLAGDETALPAIHRCLEELPAGTRVRAFIEIAEAEHRLEVRSRAELELTWVIRSEGEDLASAVQAAPWWEGTPFVWMAGEALSLKPLRRWIKNTRGVPREHTDISGYWRRREAAMVPDGLHVEAAAPDAEARIRELTGLAPSLAIRTAVALDLFRLIDEGLQTIEVLAAALGLRSPELARLLHYLSTLDFISFDAEGRVSLTKLGEMLAEPDSPLVRSLGEKETMRELSLIGLPTALRTGSAVPVANTGRTWKQLTSDDDGLGRRLAECVSSEAAEEAWFTAPAVPDALGLTEQDVVVFTGPGAEIFAEGVQRRVPRMEVSVWEEGDDALPAVGTVIALDLFGSRPSGQYATFLSSLLNSPGSADRVVVISALMHSESPSRAEVEEDLRRLCLEGAQLPHREQLAGIAAEAQVSIQKIVGVGWGHWGIVFVPNAQEGLAE